MSAREATIGRLEHPDPLRLTGRVLTRVEDAEPIRDGDATLGWTGDTRSQLYVDGQHGEWVLVRLEHDNVYRVSMAWPFSVARGHDIVPKAVVWLLEHDAWGGFVPHEWVFKTEDARHARAVAAEAEAVAAAAEVVAWAVERDGTP